MVSGSWRQYVITTRNKSELDAEVGSNRAIELRPELIDRTALAEAMRRGVLV
jgi:hypothetical protein